MKEKFYLTTPIYYPSGKWHLGHLYTTVYGDAIARYKRMRGYDVFYLTGTDEHGQKIEQRAAEKGESPKKFVDGLVAQIKQLWELMDISYTRFIRTTDEQHIKTVQKIFNKLYEQGDIYKSTYKGKYCTPCESFWTETQLKDGKCPDCGREVSDAEEDCYFFRLSKYSDRVRDLLTKTDFLQPQSRVNEMVNNFLDNSLTDFAITRTSFKWGVPVDFDNGHIVYVWVDALINYISALGYADNAADFNRYWPCDLHLMAKEIVRFHSIVWPAMLMALGIELPKKEIGHGWLMFDGDKMSKSKGNGKDPFVLAERYGVDPLRYYLFRAMPFGNDGNYTNETFLTRINADLVNNLGNLVKRTLAMSRQYFDGKVSDTAACDDIDNELISMADSLKDCVFEEMDKYNTGRALEKIFSVISRSNKYIDETAPWLMNKDESKKQRLEKVIYNLLETMRICASCLMPFLTKYPTEIFKGLGLEPPADFSQVKFGAVKSFVTEERPPLMSRLDINKETEFLNSIEEGDDADGKNKADEDKKVAEEKEKKEISIDEFFNTQLRVAEVIAAEKVEKTDKLLKLTVKLGKEQRTVVSGIAKSYTPEEMVGKQVVLVSNLKPAKLRGIESQGMILCATDGDKVVLVSPEKAVEGGSEVC